MTPLLQRSYIHLLFDDKSNTTFAVPAGVTDIRIITPDSFDGMLNIDEHPETTLVTDGSKTAPSSTVLQELNTQIAQIDTLIAPLLSLTDDQITDMLKEDAMKRLKAELAKSGVINVDSLSVVNLNIAAAAMVNYEQAVSKAVGSIGANASSEQTKAFVTEQTKNIEGVLADAISVILTAPGVTYKNTELEKAQSNIEIAKQAKLGDIVEFSDGSLDKVKDDAHKQALVGEMTRAISAPILSSLENSALEQVITFQQDRLQQAGKASRPSRLAIAGQFIAKTGSHFDKPLSLAR